VSTLYDLDRADLSAVLDGEPSYRQAQVWDGLYRQARLPAEMTDLPRRLRERLVAQAPPALRLEAEVTSDGGDTVKALWEAADGARIESVLMHYDDRSTVLCRARPVAPWPAASARRGRPASSVT